MTMEERERKPVHPEGETVTVIHVIYFCKERLKSCVQSGKDTPELFHPELLHTCISNQLKPFSDQQTVPHHSLSSLA
ncbi:unnamed protein product [Gadus morhua 'NCC']